MIQDLKIGFSMKSNQQYVPAGLRINKARLPLPLLFQKTLSCVVPRLTKSRLSGDHNGTFEPNAFQIFTFHTIFGPHCAILLPALDFKMLLITKRGFF